MGAPRGRSEVRAQRASCCREEIRGGQQRGQSAPIDEGVGVSHEGSSTHTPLHPLGGNRTTTKITNVYDSIVSILAAAELRTGLTQWRIEKGLVDMAGMTQPATLRRHLDLMVKLGYLRKIGGDSAYSTAQYDLNGEKLKEIALRRKAQEGKPRR